MFKARIARVTNLALAKLKVVRKGGHYVMLTYYKNMADYQYYENILHANIVLFALKRQQLLRQQLIVLVCLYVWDFSGLNDAAFKVQTVAQNKNFNQSTDNRLKKYSSCRLKTKLTERPLLDCVTIEVFYVRIVKS